MKKILIAGTHGMAGHVINRFLKEKNQWAVIGAARSAGPGEVELDAEDRGSFLTLLKEVKPDVVINCIGLLVKACDRDPEKAVRLNSLLPRQLAKWGRELNFKLIHISTDCVFSGEKGAYRDDDFRDGDTIYARSKALGEVIDERNLTIRTSIIGPELKADGTGLFHWLMSQHGTVNGYSQVFWSGVTTLELAEVVNSALEQQPTGLYQLSMPEKIAKLDLLKLIAEIWKRQDLDIRDYPGECCDKSMIPSVAGFNPPRSASYVGMLQKLKLWMDAHPELYRQYGC